MSSDKVCCQVEIYNRVKQDNCNHSLFFRTLACVDLSIVTWIRCDKVNKYDKWQSICTRQPFVSSTVICCLLSAEVVINVSMCLIMFLLKELNGLRCCSENWEATCSWFSGCRLQCKKAQVSSSADLQTAAHSAHFHASFCLQGFS